MRNHIHFEGMETMTHLHIVFCSPYASNPIHVRPLLQYDVDCDSGIYGDGIKRPGSTKGTALVPWSPQHPPWSRIPREAVVSRDLYHV